eukprot:CCRYP_005699-RB/>CCRYP_005699-RB protein AED:0.46 eAED:1.00 QI:0/0/0/1/0/0/2/0/88
MELPKLVFPIAIWTLKKYVSVAISDAAWRNFLKSPRTMCGEMILTAYRALPLEVVACLDMKCLSCFEEVMFSSSSSSKVVLAPSLVLE